LTVKNIQDKASTPNVIDDVAIPFDGSDEVNATTTVYAIPAAHAGDKDKIVFVFNKEMDSSTLKDTDSYKYINANVDPAKTLPGGADITVGSDNKSVTIKLPTSLTLSGSANASASTDSSNIVKEIYAEGAKDVNGNSLSIGSNGGAFTSAGSGITTVKDNSLKLYYEDGGDDLKAQVTFTNPLEDTTANQAKTNYSINGQNPDTVSIDGDKLTLTFNSSDNDDTNSTSKINTIKSQGNAATLTINKNVTDITGSVLSNASDITAPIYSYSAAPRTVNDESASAYKWEAKVDTSVSVPEVDVKVVFDTPIADSSVKPSDFTFNIGGNTVDATSAESNDTKTVTFKFTGSDYNDFVHYVTTEGASTVKVAAKSGSKISTVKDDSGDYAYYEPTSDDISGRDVTISFTDGTLTTTAGTISGTTITVPSGTTVEQVISESTPTVTVTDKDGNSKAKGALVAGDKVVSGNTTYTVALQ
jgi:hypothetical protein